MKMKRMLVNQERLLKTFKSKVKLAFRRIYRLCSLLQRIFHYWHNCANCVPQWPAMACRSMPHGVCVFVCFLASLFSCFSVLFCSFLLCWRAQSKVKLPTKPALTACLPPSLPLASCSVRFSLNNLQFKTAFHVLCVLKCVYPRVCLRVPLSLSVCVQVVRVQKPKAFEPWTQNKSKATVSMRI